MSNMLRCKRCNCIIYAGDEFAIDGGRELCMNCVVEHILENYDVYEIARSLDIEIKEHKEPEPEENPEPQIPGQIDIFGDVAT